MCVRACVCLSFNFFFFFKLKLRTRKGPAWHERAGGKSFSTTWCPLVNTTAGYEELFFNSECRFEIATIKLFNPYLASLWRNISLFLARIVLLQTHLRVFANEQPVESYAATPQLDSSVNLDFSAIQSSWFSGFHCHTCGLTVFHSSCWSVVLSWSWQVNSWSPPPQCHGPYW